MKLEIWGPRRRRWASSGPGSGLPLTVLTSLPGAGAGKAGVCPELKEELNCTQECGSDGECADNLKCCRAGCAAVCLLPNGNAGAGAGRGRRRVPGRGTPRDPGTPGQAEADGTRSAGARPS